MKKLLLICLATLFFESGFSQLDPLYSHYMFNPVSLNPAFAGYHEMTMIVFSQRYQWIGIDGSPTSYSLSAHSPLPIRKMGAGISLVNESRGITRNTEAQFQFSYQLDLGTDKLSFGLQGGFNAFKLKYASGTNFLAAPDDKTFPENDVTMTSPNFGFGALYTSEKYFGGFSIPKILSIEVDDGTILTQKYLRHYYLTGGLIYKLLNGTVIKPSVLLKVFGNSTVNYDLNLSMLFREKIWAAVSLRNSFLNSRDFVIPNAVVLLAQLQVTDQLKIGYSTDIPLEEGAYLQRAADPIQARAFGRFLLTHEIMINVNLAIFENQAIQTVYY